MKRNYLKKAVVFSVIAVLITVAVAPAIGSSILGTNEIKNKGKNDQPMVDILSNNQPVLSPKEITKIQKETYAEQALDKGWYWKPPYPNYAPHTSGGMPDFDQKQDQWKTIEPGPNGVIDSTVSGDDIYNPTENCIAPGPNCHLESNSVGDDVVVWSFCGPVAVANCFWWFDSKFADPGGQPGDGEDDFDLVEDYSAGDDHDSDNVPLLIEELASAMQTCSKGTTYIDDMQDAIDDWFDDTGLGDIFEENTYAEPEFDFIELEIERSQDVILLLGFYDYVEGDKIVDQQQTLFNTNDNLQTFTWWDFQSFVPAVSRLDAIQVCLVSNGASCDVEINVYDTWQGAPIGTSVMNPGNLVTPTWVQFHFDPYVPLTPGNLYYFDVRQIEDGYHYEWMYQPQPPDGYPPGQGWMDTMPTDYSGLPFDWTFKTEFYDPIPGWYRKGGHYVTCAGVNSDQLQIAFSDPYWNIQNPSGDDHNDAQYVSHDIYDVQLGAPSSDLGCNWWIPDFPTYPNDYQFAIVEQAVVICPTDEEPPTVEITKPINAIYLMDTELFPFLFAFAIGSLTVEADADDDVAIDKVEFYLDDVLKETDTVYPYRWKWSEFAFGKYTVKATAYDTVGNSASDEITVIKLF